MADYDHFVGTRAVSEKHAFDIAALTAWLVKNLDGFKGPLTVELFKGGQSNPKIGRASCRERVLMPV